MAVNVAQVAAFVGVTPSEPLLPGLLTLATTMVQDYLGPNGYHRCPYAIVDGAVIQLASDLWNRRNAPNAAAQWGPGGEVIYLPADVMKAVKPMIRQYRGLGTCG